MRDETHRKSARSLQRPVGLGPHWRRRLAGIAVLVGVSTAIAGAAVMLALRVRPRDCAAIAHHPPVETAVQLCTQEYQATGDPKTGALLAHALVKSGDLKAARMVATPLRASIARPDVLQVLGDVAYREERIDEAIELLEAARGLHRLTGDRLQLARDAGLLVNIRTDRGEYAQALILADECITTLRHGEDPGLEWYCYTVAGRNLLTLGYFADAANDLQYAQTLAVEDDQRTDVKYQLGSLAQEQGHNEQAIEIFREVLRDRQRSGHLHKSLRTEENLAYALAERHQFEEANQHLQNAKRLDVDHTQEREWLWVAARIAYEEEDFARAAALTDAYFKPQRDAGAAGGNEADDLEDQDDLIDVLSLRTQVELKRKDLSSAASWGRRAVVEAERIRSKQPVELRPQVLAKYHLAYELEFSALARAGRIEDAIMVFDQWQGRAVRDALVRKPPPGPAGDRIEIAERITKLSGWLHAPMTPIARNADRMAVLNTMRHIDLIAVIVANNDVWRLEVTHGAPRLLLVGYSDEVRDGVEALASHPAEVGKALLLGTQLMPDAVFRATSETLHVVIDQRLAELPVAALRRGGIPLGGLRPIVQELRLPEVPCVAARRPGHATVLNPQFGLLYAHLEAMEVAELLGTTAKTGTDATTAALWATGDDVVLHVAGHAGATEAEATMQLWDREVSALEIAARLQAPSLVVLSNCSSAISSTNNVELIDSMAAAFLAAGAQHVVATLRSVDDAGARAVVNAFYRADAVRDPARALYAARTALWRTKNVEWPIFTVFGPDVCQ